jgi:hypothetical protein
MLDYNLLHSESTGLSNCNNDSLQSVTSRRYRHYQLQQWESAVCHIQKVQALATATTIVCSPSRSLNVQFSSNNNVCSNFLPFSLMFKRSGGHWSWFLWKPFRLSEQQSAVSVYVDRRCHDTISDYTTLFTDFTQHNIDDHVYNVSS